MGAVMARRHLRCGAGGTGSGGAMEIDSDTAGVGSTGEKTKPIAGAHSTARREGGGQLGRREPKIKCTSANTPPTRGLAGPARLNSARERREASGAGWAEG
jgi:hypothetical protein